MCEMFRYIRLIEKYQRNSFSPAPISAYLTSGEIPYFWIPWLGYLVLYGRSLHCVSPSGLLWSTSVNYDSTQQVGLLGTVSRCWWKLTWVTSWGEVTIWMQFSFSTHVFHMLAFWLSLVSISVYSLQRSQRYVSLSPTSTCGYDSSFL